MARVAWAQSLASKFELGSKADHCRWQNFHPSLLRLVDGLYTVIKKTQKTRTKVLPSAMVGAILSGYNLDEIRIM